MVPKPQYYGSDGVGLGHPAPMQSLLWSTSMGDLGSSTLRTLRLPNRQGGDRKTVGQELGKRQYVQARPHR